MRTNPNPLATYEVPRAFGTLWTVFEYDGRSGQIFPINTTYYSNSDGDVQ